MSLPVTGVHQFERFFRVVASLDVDKRDVRRYQEFVDRKLSDLLLRGQAAARANVRDLVEPHDLPITKGLQSCVHEFRRLDSESEVGLKCVIDDLIQLPPQEIPYTLATEAELPYVAGGLSVALARTFPVLDPNVVNPQTEQWERAFRIFDMLV
jgi:hypothetical protein